MVDGLKDISDACCPPEINTKCDLCDPELTGCYDTAVLVPFLPSGDRTP